LKNALLVVLLIFTFSKSNAGPEFGLTLGMGIDNLHNSSYTTQVENDLHLGISAGIIGRFVTGKSSKFIPALTFNQKGHGYDNSNVKLNLNYLCADLFFEWQPRNKLFFELGPQFAYLLSAKKVFGNYYGTVVSITSRYCKLDVLGCAGLGLNFSSKTSVAIRYLYGFLNIEKQFDPGYSSYYISDYGIYNRQITFSFRYFLEQKK
jgi:hypothetical protein